jgi:Raf kinase inhibitor-like YbhB/YbcL family protein
VRPIVIAAVVTTMGLAAIAQEPARQLAIEQLRGNAAAISVTSKSFSANGSIPVKYADYGEKVSPDLSWSGVPASAKALVLLVEDPDAREPKPFVHWVLYNLPPSTKALPESIPGQPRLPEFGGVLQGRNSRGTIGYFGPRPPKGDPPHHYHFQIFAVDAPLTLDPSATATAVLAALKGHVVAAGELVATFQAP